MLGSGSSYNPALITSPKNIWATHLTRVPGVGLRRGVTYKQEPNLESGFLFWLLFSTYPELEQTSSIICHGAGCKTPEGFCAQTKLLRGSHVMLSLESLGALSTVVQHCHLGLFLRRPVCLSCNDKKSHHDNVRNAFLQQHKIRYVKNNLSFSYSFQLS